jgi:hypothetical protein
LKILLAIFTLCISLFANIGVVKSIKGKLSITRENKVFYALAGEKIFQQDRLETYEKSKVKIILNDDTVISLGENTNYIIDSYSDKQDPHLDMKLNEGLAHIISGKIGKLAPNRFKLKTKTALIGIRGTEWKTFTYKKTLFCVCKKGTIFIKFLKKINLLKAGQMLYIKDKKVRRFNTNMIFFNRMTKSKIKFKKLPKIKTKLITNNKNKIIKTQSKIKIKNSNLSSDTKTKNIDISNNASANIGNIDLK